MGSPAIAVQVQYRSSSSHGNADALSRLPRGHDKTFDQIRQQDEEAEQFVASLETQNVNNGLLVYKQLQKYARKDAVLQEIIIQEGWPAKLSNASVKPYSSCKHQRSVIDGCLLKHGDETTRVVVSSDIRQLLLLQLHSANVGSARMRKLARRYIWWPGIDRDIDKMVCNCDACALHRNSLPTVPLHPWPFKNFMWLIIVDAHSKWPEVFKFQVGSSGTKQVISSLKHLIASFGIPKQIVCGERV